MTESCEKNTKQLRETEIRRSHSELQTDILIYITVTDCNILCGENDAKSCCTLQHLTSFQNSQLTHFSVSQINNRCQPEELLGARLGTNWSIELSSFSAASRTKQKAAEKHVSRGFVGVLEHFQSLVDSGDFDLNTESQSRGSDPAASSVLFGMDGKNDCILCLNSGKLWTPRAFHTVKLSRPTPHQAYREPQPRALRARDAPLSGTDAVAATPCGGNRR